MTPSLEIPERAAVSSRLDAIGGELLAGSGFETEQADSDFSLSADLEE
ncbi:MAG TPA: hypothetical protein VME17_07485 [Bryobacteraceae bacterium]|nr:hypothetical protein [Bryobacteraceae bacterium]